MANDDLINVKDFLNSWLEIVPDTFSLKNKNTDEFIKNDTQFTDSTLNELKESCNPLLLIEEETLKFSKDINDLRSANLSSINYVLDNYGLTTKNNQALDLKLLKNINKLSKASVEPENMIELPDVLLRVQISQSLSSTAKKKFSWSEEFLVLGQNYLTSLKEKISCFRNELIIGEYSETPDYIKELPKLEDVIQSGYFFIENIFYNDTRDNNNDCSVEIIKWALEKNIASFESKRMEETKFSDLNIKLGYPYLFCHLGNCEHLVLFVNMRLVNPMSDSYDIQKYPVLRDRNRGRYLHCWLCDTLYAKWVIRNSECVVDDPCLLCERCFKNTHYNENGKKLCNFKAYHFPQMF